MYIAILKYIKENPGNDALDIATDLKIPIDLAYKIVDNLIKKGKVIQKYIGLETILEIK